MELDSEGNIKPYLKEHPDEDLEDVFKERYKKYMRCEICGKKIPLSRTDCCKKCTQIRSDMLTQNRIGRCSPRYSLAEVAEMASWKRRWSIFKRDNKWRNELTEEEFITIRKSPCACGSSEDMIFKRKDTTKPMNKDNYHGICKKCSDNYTKKNRQIRAQKKQQEEELAKKQNIKKRTRKSVEKKIRQYKNTVKYYCKEIEKYEELIKDLHSTV